MSNEFESVLGSGSGASVDEPAEQMLTLDGSSIGEDWDNDAEPILAIEGTGAIPMEFEIDGHTAHVSYHPAFFDIDLKTTGDPSSPWHKRDWELYRLWREPRKWSAEEEQFLRKVCRRVDQSLPVCFHRQRGYRSSCHEILSNSL